MCDVITPTMLAWAAFAASAVGGGVAAYSSHEQGQAAKATGKYNEEMENRKALDAAERGSDQAAQLRTRARRVAAAQVEGAAMSGVDVNSGTPLALLTETAGLGELDALRAMNNAQREAWGFKSQGQLDSFSGRAAGRAGNLNAGGSLLTTAGNSYYGYKTAMRG